MNLFKISKLVYPFLMFIHSILSTKENGEAMKGLSVGTGRPNMHLRLDRSKITEEVKPQIEPLEGEAFLYSSHLISTIE